MECKAITKMPYIGTMEQSFYLDLLFFIIFKVIDSFFELFSEIVNLIL